MYMMIRTYILYMMLWMHILYRMYTRFKMYRMYGSREDRPNGSFLRFLLSCEI